MSQYEDYRSGGDRVRALCLHLATRLYDLMDEIVIVGGLVPSLLVPLPASEVEVDPHCGTLDVDLGLSLALLDSGRYAEVAARLRSSGFEPCRNSANRTTLQRWRVGTSPTATVDFLVPPTRTEVRGGRLVRFAPDFAASVTPGLDLAFVDRRQVKSSCQGPRFTAST